MRRSLLSTLVSQQMATVPNWRPTHELLTFILDWLQPGLHLAAPASAAALLTLAARCSMQTPSWRSMLRGPLAQPTGLCKHRTLRLRTPFVIHSLTFLVYVFAAICLRASLSSLSCSSACASSAMDFPFAVRGFFCPPSLVGVSAHDFV